MKTKKTKGFISIFLSMFLAAMALITQPALAACPSPDNRPIENSCMGKDGPIPGKFNCASCCAFKDAVFWRDASNAYSCKDAQETSSLSTTDFLKMNQPLYAAGKDVDLVQKQKN